MELLKVKNISKSFKSEKALDDFSLCVSAGETVVIIGPSGSGKTTFLRCLNFLERIDQGEIYIHGSLLFDGEKDKIKEDQIRKIRSHFGLVFQNFNLFPQYNVYENITLAMKLNGIDDYHETAINLLEKMGLTNKKDSYPNQLSGGQKQRVAIARALALKPDILCFDEPTSALDPELTNEIARQINDLKSKENTMIIVTHDLSFARKVADRIVFMLCGKMIEEAETEEFFNHPKKELTKQFLNN